MKGVVYFFVFFGGFAVIFGCRAYFVWGKLFWGFGEAGDRVVWIFRICLVGFRVSVFRFYLLL